MDPVAPGGAAAAPGVVPGARLRLGLLGALYFAQGVPWGLVTVTLALQLTRAGFGAAQLAPVFMWATLPYTFKFVMGPLVDRLGARRGQRRRLIFAAELAMAITLVALTTVDPVTRFGAFLAMVFVHNVCAAFQDVATDGLAIAILPVHERGRANGVMSAAKFIGSLAGGPGLSFLATRAGWPVAAAVAAGMTLIPSVLLPFVREPAVASAGVAMLRGLWAAFRPRVARMAAAFALISGASEALVSPLMFPLLRQQLGVSDDRINGLTLLAGLVQAVAAIAGGWLADRLGRRRTVVLGALGMAAVHAGFALARPWWSDPGFLIAFTVAGAVASGVLYSSTLAWFMDLTDPSVAATQFQIFMALSNVRLSWAPAAGGALSGHLSTAVLFGVAATLELASLVTLPRQRAGQPGASVAQ